MSGGHFDDPSRQREPNHRNRRCPSSVAATLTRWTCTSWVKWKARDASTWGSRLGWRSDKKDRDTNFALHLVHDEFDIEVVPVTISRTTEQVVSSPNITLHRLTEDAAEKAKKQGSRSQYLRKWDPNRATPPRAGSGQALATAVRTPTATTTITCSSNHRMPYLRCARIPTTTCRRYI